MPPAVPQAAPPEEARPDPAWTPAETFTARSAVQARLLLDLPYGARLLEQFLTPGTPSDAAARLGEPANRVTYHVNKHVEAGLLREAGRRGRRTLYRTVARSFRVPSRFLPLDEPLSLVAPIMHDLALGLARSRLAADPEGAALVQLGGRPRAHGSPDEPPFPSLLAVAGKRLSAAQYARLRAELLEVLGRYDAEAAAAEEGMAEPEDCVFALVAFRGDLQTGGP